MNLEKFVLITFNEERLTLRPRIVCNDGFNMSVQGNEGAYCSPRKNSEFYTEMEIGFPSEEVKEILEYTENPDIPTETVYGYVPCELIQKVIDLHGGINIKETFTKKL